MARKKKIEQQVADPLLTIAQGISESQADEEVYEEKPVEIVEFVESRKFLNQKWNGRTGCRPKILEILVKVADPGIRELILLMGKGSGKDYSSSIMHLYGIYRCLCLANPQSYFGLGPSPIYFVNTARNEKQSRKVFFAQFLSLLNECVWFQGKYREPGMDSVIFDKNIEALSANSQAFSWLGYNIIQWVGDELAFFLEKDDDEESESRAQECWEAALGSCKTRFPRHYKMIGITTPRYDDDFVMKKYYELKERPDAYTIQAATWDINPNLSKEDFKYEFVRDYRRAMRDYGAEPSGVIESFWPDPKMVEDFVCETCRSCPVYQNREKTDNNMYSCFDYEDCKANAYMGNGKWREWFKPPADFNDFTMHFDLAKNKDRIGFSLGRIVGEVRVELDAYKIKEKMDQDPDTILDDDDKFQIKPLILIEAVGFISNNSPDRDSRMLKNGEFYYKAILNEIILTLKTKGFSISTITFDQFQSHFIKQELEDRGYQVELISLDRTDEIPVAAKYAIVEQRVQYPYSWVLCNEAEHLKFIAGKKVDHARKSSKDIWDGFAGTIYDCEKFLSSTGAFLILDNNEDE